MENNNILKLVKKEDKQYQYNLVADYNCFTLERYEVRKKGANYSCVKEIQLCIVPDSEKNAAKLVSGIKPKKFFFEEFCYYQKNNGEIGFEEHLLLDACCGDGSDVFNDKRLGETSKNKCFQENVVAILLEKSKIKRGGSLMYVPSPWFEGFRLVQEDVLLGVRNAGVSW